MQLTEEEVADVYRRFGYLVLRRCRVVVRNDALADDALQEVFVRLMRYGKSFREAENPLRWMYRVSDNVCFDLLRRQKQRREQAEPEHGEHRESEQAGAVHDAHESTAAQRDLAMHLLAGLSTELQQIAILYFVDGLSQADIGEELKLSRQTINKKIDQLRTALAQRRDLLEVNHDR